MNNARDQLRAPVSFITVQAITLNWTCQLAKLNSDANKRHCCCKRWVQIRASSDSASFAAPEWVA
eukprot:scaffold32745_cov29-Prasinocladus_malaysianus.AAC.1